jgi:hypothetical protein
MLRFTITLETIVVEPESEAGPGIGLLTSDEEVVDVRAYRVHTKRRELCKQ